MPKLLLEIIEVQIQEYKEFKNSVELNIDMTNENVITNV
jgi:hypothetical protein